MTTYIYNITEKHGGNAVITLSFLRITEEKAEEDLEKWMKKNLKNIDGWNYEIYNTKL